MCAFGVSLNAQKAPSSEYIQAVKELALNIVYRLRRFWLSSDFIYNLTANGKKNQKALQIVHNFSESVIREQQKKTDIHEKEYEDENWKYTSNLKSFVKLLIETRDEDGNSLPFKEIRDQADTFMFEVSTFFFPIY